MLKIVENGHHLIFHNEMKISIIRESIENEQFLKLLMSEVSITRLCIEVNDSLGYKSLSDSQVSW